MQRLTLLAVPLLFLLASCDDGVVGRASRDAGDIDALGADADAGPGDTDGCIPDCGERKCGLDLKCGISCGECAEGERCGDEGLCLCRPETESELCTELQLACGSRQVFDRCGKERFISCPDTCVQPKLCDAESNTCFCEGAPDEPAGALCQLAMEQEGVECGAGAVADGCGEIRYFNCGERCGAEPWFCNENNRCDCPYEPDELICERLGKKCGTLQARDQCGVTRLLTCTDLSGETTCAAPEVCTNNLCRDPEALWSNDTCDFGSGFFRPEKLALLDGRVEFVADTRYALDDVWGSCDRTSGGNDLVYELYLDEVSELSVTATPQGAVPGRPVIHIRTTCSARESELACSTSPDAYAATHAEVPFAGPGNVYIWIDSYYSMNAGEQRVTVTARPLPRRAGDTCESARELGFLSQPLGEGRITSLPNETLVGMTASEAASACAFSGPDTFYRFTPAADMSATFSVTAAGATLKPSLAIGTGCASMQELLCNSDAIVSTSMPNSTHTTLLAPDLKAGITYWLRLGSSTGGSQLQLRLDVTHMRAATHLTCNEAELIQLSAPEWSSTIGGDTRLGAHRSPVSSCIPVSTSDRELVYAIEVPTGSGARNLFVSLAAQPPTVASALLPALSLRSGCGAGSSELPRACARSSAYGEGVSLAAFGLVEGSIYYLQVDSTFGGHGYFDLTVSMPPRAPVPLNDTCAGADEGDEYQLLPDLTPGEETYAGSVSGTTFGASNARAVAQCESSGAEVAYRLQVETPSTLHARVSATSDGFQPTLYLLRSCADSAPAGASCGTRAGAHASLAMDLTQTGTYYLIVDGAHGTEGTFDLDYSIFPLISNLACGAEAALSVANGATTRVVSDTIAGGNQQTSSCRATGSGKELLWKLELQAGLPKDLLIRVIPLPGSAMVPGVSLRSECGSLAGKSERGCAAAEETGPLELTVERLDPAKPYYLWVESTPGMNGAFLLEVTSNDSPMAPNRTCASATHMTDWVATARGSRLSIEGDTNLSLHTDAARCASDASGPELFYKITLPFLANLSIELAPASGSELSPTLSVRRGCGPLDPDLTCQAGMPVGKLLSRMKAVSGQLFIFVDSRDTEAVGRFTLTVDALPAASPPQEDTCANAQELRMGPTPSRLLLPFESTENARDDYRGGCATAAQPHNGADIAYRIYLPDDGLLTARVHAKNATGAPPYLPALYLRTGDGCDGLVPDSEFACANALGELASASITAAGGAWYSLIVDGISESDGEYSLELTTELSAPVPNSCNVAVDLDELALLSSKTLYGNTQLATDVSRSSNLQIGDGADLVYRLRLTAPHTLSARLTFAETNGLALLYLRDGGCMSGPASDELLAVAGAAGGPALLTTTLEEGEYYLWVDSTRPLDGFFMLELSLGAPPAAPIAACNEVTTDQRLALHGNGTLEVEGSTFSGWHTTSGRECAGGSTHGNEALYRVTIPTDRPHALTARVERLPGAHAGFSPVLYLRTGCEQADTQLACVAAGESLRLPVASGTYYLYVDSYTPGGGPFKLNLELFDAASESCQQAAAVPFDAQGYARITGDSGAAKSDLDFTCAAPQSGTPGSIAGHDLAYRLIVPSGPAKSLRVALSLPYRDTSSAAIMVEPLEGTSCARAASPFPLCERREGSGKATLTWSSIPAGEYLVWLVPGLSEEAGPFIADFDLAEVLPPVHPLPPTPVQMTNATCLAAQELTLIEGRAMATGTLSSNNTMGVQCRAQAGFEAAYSVKVPGPGKLRASAIQLSGSFWAPALEIRSKCDQVGAAPQCVFSLDSSKALTTSLTISAAGEYFVWLDSGAGTTPASYALFVQFEEERSASALCSAPLPLPAFDSAGMTFATGSFEPGESGNSEGTCAAGPEHYYSFTLEYPSLVSAMVLGNDFNTMFVRSFGFGTLATPMVYLLSSCGAEPSSSACALGTNGRNEFTRMLAAGTHTIVVESPTAPAANKPLLYALAIGRRTESSSVLNDSCDGIVTALQPNGLGHVKYVERIGLENARNDLSSSSCGDTTGPDLLYRVDVPPNQTLSVTVKPITWGGLSAQFKPSLELRRDCASLPASLLKCSSANAAGETVTVATDTRGASSTTSIYIVVDSAAGATGEFELELQMLPIKNFAPNDHCGPLDNPGASATLLNFASNSTSSYGGTLSDASDNSAGSCGAMPGPDKVYKFVLEEASSLDLRLTAMGFEPALYVQATCGEQQSELQGACTLGTNGVASIDFSYVAPGVTYYLWVDALDKDATGTFWIDAITRSTSLTATPGGCRSLELPIDLTNADVTKLSKFSFTKSNWANTTSGGCAAMTGQDFAYAFTLSQPRQVTLEAIIPLELQVPDTFPSYYLRKESCDDERMSAEYGCLTGMLAPLVIPRLEPGTYYAFVDFPNLLPRGEQQLQITIRAPAASPPANDRCTGAIPLTAGTTVRGDTREASNSYSWGRGAAPGCGNLHYSNGYGPDLVYSHTTGSNPVPFTVKLTPIISGPVPWSAGLWIGSDCELATSCIGGSQEDDFEIQIERLTVSNPLPNHTYFIFVDGYGRGIGFPNAGAFDLLLTE